LALTGASFGWTLCKKSPFIVFTLRWGNDRKKQRCFVAQLTFVSFISFPLYIRIDLEPLTYLRNIAPVSHVVNRWNSSPRYRSRRYTVVASCHNISHSPFDRSHKREIDAFSSSQPVQRRNRSNHTVCVSHPAPTKLSRRPPCSRLTTRLGYGSSGGLFASLKVNALQGCSFPIH